MDIIDMWARSLRSSGRSQRTIDAYREDVDMLTLHRAGVEPGTVDRFATAKELRVQHPIEDVTRGDIEEFLVWCRDVRGLADATIARRFRSLQQFFGWLNEIDETDSNTMATMKPPKVVDRPPPIISDDDVRKLLDACAGKLANGGQRRRNYNGTKLVEYEVRRDTAIVQILRTSGCRAAELMNLALVDVNLDAQTFTVVGKGNRIRSIALVADSAAALDKYLLARRRHQHAGHPALWLSRKGPLSISGLAQMLRRRCEDAGIERINPHAFRHTFAHNAKVHGISDENLMAVAGWQSPQMLQRYGRAATEERAQAAHRQMFRDAL